MSKLPDWLPAIEVKIVTDLLDKALVDDQTVAVFDGHERLRRIADTHRLSPKATGLSFRMLPTWKPPTTSRKSR